MASEVGTVTASRVSRKIFARRISHDFALDAASADTDSGRSEIALGKMVSPSKEAPMERTGETKRRCMAAALAATPESVQVVEVRRSLSGRAWREDGGHKISAPRPITRSALHIYLHECAHVALGHCDENAPRIRAADRERAAEDWAFAKMRANGIAVPRKSQKSARDYVARKVRQGRAAAHRHAWEPLNARQEVCRAKHPTRGVCREIRTFPTHP
jgi:hypothetical protein